MKKVKKCLLMIIVIFLLSACGTNNDKNIDSDVANNSVEKVYEVVSTRSIVVSDVNGSVIISHGNGEKLEAYEGMNLFDGDDVVVSMSSNVTLNVDSDKHIFADENTHFWLTATGSEDKTNTLIHLDKGSVLCDIKEKLDDDETFDIQTASSTMCVRGTVFRVCLLTGKDNSVFDLVEVYDGKVWSNIDNSEENVTLEPGQCALIRKNELNGEQAKYVLGEDINLNFIEETGLNISLEDATDGETGALKISLENVPLDTLSRLEAIIEEGTELVVGKEELEKVKEVKEQEKANESLKGNHEHKYVEQSRIASTCVTPGSVSYTCSICGDKKTESLPLADHTPSTIKGHSASCTEDGETDGLVCGVCGTVLESQSVIRASGHKDVLDADGVTHKCSICGTTLRVDNGNAKTYSVVSFDDSSFTNAQYTSTYDSDNQQLVYDFSIPYVSLKATDTDGITVTSVTNASIIAEYRIPFSELVNESPDYYIDFSYDGCDVSISGDAETQYLEGAISKNLYNYIASDFSNFRISEVPDFSINKNSVCRLLEPKIRELNYQVQVTLPALADYKEKQSSGGNTYNNVNVNYNFTVNLYYNSGVSECQGESSWEIHSYCFNKNHKNYNGSSGDKISDVFNSGLYETFIGNIKTYAKGEITKG